MKTKIPRKAQRYPLDLIVREVNSKRVMDTYLKDISTTGFRVEAPALYPPRGTMEFKIGLPGSEKEFMLAGQVIWSIPVLKAPGRFMMGVKFHIPKWDMESLLRSWQA
jgi:hypothetical protein